jgi:hypothetical protein
MVDVNERPALLVRDASGVPAVVLSVELENGAISDIWAIANPDKLGRLS